MIKGKHHNIMNNIPEKPGFFKDTNIIVDVVYFYVYIFVCMELICDCRSILVALDQSELIDEYFRLTPN
jgi:hypothetical protein